MVIDHVRAPWAKASIQLQRAGEVLGTLVQISHKKTAASVGSRNY